ncbi:hypothetical protein, partial [Leyella stercorea]|uniref:hypothetical protein n=2 Tax=Leyella stercorea TaxID=363265 RepID=UPI003AB59996
HIIMKNFILALFFMLISCVTMAQEKEHMKFMGIPINGTELQFETKLKSKGFVRKSRINENVLEMVGKFAGSKVEVYIVSTNNLVWKILVDYPEESTFSSLSSFYDDMVEQFKIKYGIPSDHFEFFSKPYYKGDGYELQALKLEKCTYASYWETSTGIISVSLTKYANLRIVYEDAVGVAKKHETNEKQIQNDI